MFTACLLLPPSGQKNSTFLEVMVVSFSPSEVCIHRIFSRRAPDNFQPCLWWQKLECHWWSRNILGCVWCNANEWLVTTKTVILSPHICPKKDMIWALLRVYYAKCKLCPEVDTRGGVGRRQLDYPGLISLEAWTWPKSQMSLTFIL